MTRSLETTPSDLWCWLWAAVPPTKRGWLDVPRAARRLGVSESTVRRWLRLEHFEMPWAVKRRVMQLAILRGRGHLLWPAPDAATIEREQRQRTYAVRAVAAGLDKGTSGDLVITHHPRGHAYTVSVLSDGKSLDRIVRAGGIVEYQQAFPDLWSAQVAKFGVLDAIQAHRCILPKTLAPRSHTLAWREAGGVPTPPGEPQPAKLGSQLF